jgi:hypothetical protein
MVLHGVRVLLGISQNDTLEIDYGKSRFDQITQHTAGIVDFFGMRGIEIGADLPLKNLRAGFEL